MFAHFFSDKCFGFSVQGVVSSGVMLFGCKPIARSLAGRTPSTDPPFQKDPEPFSLAVSGTAAHIRQSICFTSFSETFSAHFGEFPHNLHWRSRNDFGEMFRKKFVKFPQLLQFAVCVCVCVCVGGSLRAAECVAVLSCSVQIECLHCPPT